MRLKRIWRRIDEWEEIEHNMWGAVSDIAAAKREAFCFTSNASLYGSYMSRVIKEMPASCENALTDYNINRKAWLGQAAVALALNIPEDITRAAWKELNDEQRFLANREAAKYIRIWEDDHVKSGGIREGLDQPMLF